MMESSDSNNNDANVYPPITIIKDSHLKLSLSSSSSSSRKQSSSSSTSSIKLAVWKDERLDYLDIPKGLIELLQAHGFTIEMILESGSSQIAEKLGIDNYIAQIIFEKTTKKYKF